MRYMWLLFWCIVLVVLGGTATIAIVVFKSTPPSNSSSPYIEAVKATLLCLGGGGVILSTYFTAVNSFIQRKFNVIENTFSIVARWDDPHLFEARKLTRRAKETRDDKSKNELLKEIESDEDLKQSVILVLNYFEHVRFSLETKRIDKVLFKDSLGDVVADIVDRFMPFAEKKGSKVVADLNTLLRYIK